MNKPTIYQIVVRGRATERILRPIIDDFTVDHSELGLTTLTGAVRDPAHLHGVLAHLTSVAAEIISLTPVGPDVNGLTRDRPEPSGRHSSPG